MDPVNETVSGRATVLQGGAEEPAYDISCIPEDRVRQRVLAEELILLREATRDVAVIMPWPMYEHLMREMIENYTRKHPREELTDQQREKLKTWEEIKKELEAGA